MAKGSATGSSSIKSSGERELQMRILRFLGGLGGNSHYLVVDASEVSTYSSRLSCVCDVITHRPHIITSQTVRSNSGRQLACSICLASCSISAQY
jgi:hypothetical protein